MTSQWLVRLMLEDGWLCHPKQISLTPRMGHWCLIFDSCPETHSICWTRWLLIAPMVKQTKIHDPTHAHTGLLANMLLEMMFRDKQSHTFSFSPEVLRSSLLGSNRTRNQTLVRDPALGCCTRKLYDEGKYQLSLGVIDKCQSLDLHLCLISIMVDRAPAPLWHNQR